MKRQSTEWDKYLQMTQQTLNHQKTKLLDNNLFNNN